MTKITDEMLDIIEKVKGKRNPALWDPRCEQYLAKNKKGDLMNIKELLLNDLKLITNIYSDSNNVFSDTNFVNNSPEELLEATKEFLNYIENYSLNPTQKRFQETFFDSYDPSLVRDIYGEQAHSKKIKGVISSTFLEKYEKSLF